MMDSIGEFLKVLSTEDIDKLRRIFSGGSEFSNFPSVSLRVFCYEYEQFIMQNRSFNYYKNICASNKQLLKFFEPQTILTSITLKDIELFITQLQHKVKKGYRVYYRALKASFNKAVDWRYIKENHFIKVKLPKKNKLNPHFITPEDLNGIVENINSEIVKDVVMFAFFSGMRLNEIVNLRWENIDFENRIIIVGSEEYLTKGRNQRYIPFNTEIEEILDNRKKRDKFLSQINNNIIIPLISKNEIGKRFVFGKCELNFKMNIKYSGDYFSRSFKKACRVTGLNEAVHFHTLRHSFASNLAQQGVSLYIIKELLGHESISTTEIYSHLNIESLRNAVCKIENTKSIIKLSGI